MTLKEVKEQKKKYQELKRKMKYKKNYGHIYNKKLDKVIELIDSHKSNLDIKTNL